MFQNKSSPLKPLLHALAVRFNPKNLVDKGQRLDYPFNRNKLWFISEIPASFISMTFTFYPAMGYMDYFKEKAE